MGIPSRVGIGRTKTLAKLANRLTKKTLHGVATVLPGSPELGAYPVKDVWGMGHKLKAMQDAEGILSPVALVRADPVTLRARYGVTLAPTQRELKGGAATWNLLPLPRKIPVDTCTSPQALD